MSAQLPKDPIKLRDLLLALWSSLPRLEVFEAPTTKELSEISPGNQLIVGDILKYFKKVSKGPEQSAASTPYTVDKLQEIYDSFMALCRGIPERPYYAIVDKFDATRNTDAKCLPWEASGSNHTGYIWAAALARAASELPGFLEEDIKVVPARLERLKETLSKEVGRQHFELHWAFKTADGGEV